MAIDRFAAVRRAAMTQPPSNYADPEPSLPGVTHAEVTQKPQISAVLPALPALPAEITDAEAWKRRSADLVASTEMPIAWAEGVVALQMMAVPDGAAEVRWQQIVDDATNFAIRRHRRAIAAGWTIEDVFGFDPDDDGTSYGLVVEIRGGAPIVLDDGVIAVNRGERSSYFYRGKGEPGVPMIWTINRKREERMRRIKDGR